MKKKLSILLIMVLLFVSLFSLTGCGINPDAEEYESNFGVTMMLHSDGEDNYANVEIVTDKYISDMRSANSYILQVLSTEFDAKTDDEYPYYSTEYALTVFSFTIKLTENEKDWFDYGLSYGVMNITLSFDYENPFATVYKEDTALNRIYNILQEGSNTLDGINSYIGGVNLDTVYTKLLIPVRNTVKVETGTIIYDDYSDYHYYQLAGELNQMVDTRAVYTYTAMASYGYFGIAIVLGLAAVGLVILFAKKKDGKLVDLKQRPRGYGGNPYDGHGGGGYGGYRKPDVDPFNPDSTGSDNSGTGDNNGNVFDGF